MEAFQLRLWDGRLGRWLSPDPYGQYASPYLGMGNNPINGVDPDGGWYDPPTEGTFENGYVHTDDKGSWTYNSTDNTWWDNLGGGNDIFHGTVFLNDVNVGFNMQTNNSFSWVDGNSRLQFPAEYMKNNGDLSKYLKLSDVIKSNTALKLNIDNTPTQEHLNNLKAFGKDIYDPLYEEFNGNIKISSGYRSQGLNTAVGGSANSQHLTGEALDIQGINRVSNSDIFNYTKKNLNYHQLIWEYGTKTNPKWVHIGYRVNGNNGYQIFSIPKNLKTNF